MSLPPPHTQYKGGERCPQLLPAFTATLDCVNQSSFTLQCCPAPHLRLKLILRVEAHKIIQIVVVLLPAAPPRPGVRGRRPPLAPLLLWRRRGPRGGCGGQAGMRASR